MIETVTKIVEAILPSINKAIPDKDLATKLAHEIALKQMDTIQGQLEINKQEAAHKSIFVAGARPAIMWMCGIALFYSVMLRDLLITLAMLIWDKDLSMIPAPDATLLFNILLGLLGLIGARSYDKKHGTVTNSISKE